jgi:TPR repeat protein
MSGRIEALALGLMIAVAGCKARVDRSAAVAAPHSAPAAAALGADPCGGLAPQPCGEKGTAFLLLSPADERAAQPLLDSACARGNADACTNLGGLMTSTLDRVLHDERRALDAFVRGCQLGDNWACCGGGKIREIGSVMGPPVAKDFGAAALLYRVGCEHGEFICCVELGNLYVVGGPGLAKNKRLAAEYYRKARKLGYREDQDGD